MVRRLMTRAWPVDGSLALAFGISFALFGELFAILDHCWPEITVAFYLDG